MLTARLATLGAMVRDGCSDQQQAIDFVFATVPRHRPVPVRRLHRKLLKSGTATVRDGSRWSTPHTPQAPACARDASRVRSQARGSSERKEGGGPRIPRAEAPNHRIGAHAQNFFDRGTGHFPVAERGFSSRGAGVFKLSDNHQPGVISAGSALG